MARPQMAEDLASSLRLLGGAVFHNPPEQHHSTEGQHHPKGGGVRKAPPLQKEEGQSGTSPQGARKGKHHPRWNFSSSLWAGDICLHPPLGPAAVFPILVGGAAFLLFLPLVNILKVCMNFHEHADAWAATNFTCVSSKLCPSTRRWAPYCSSVPLFATAPHAKSKTFVRDVCGFIRCARPLTIVLSRGKYMCHILGRPMKASMTPPCTFVVYFLWLLMPLEHARCFVPVVPSAVGVGVGVEIGAHTQERESQMACSIFFRFSFALVTCCCCRCRWKSQNIATCCTSSTFSSFMFTSPIVVECCATIDSLGALVPRSATFSSLLTLPTLNLMDLNSSCLHNCATCSCFQRPMPRLWRMCSVALCINSQHWFHHVSEITQQRHYPFLTRTLPTLLRTILTPRCSSQRRFVYMCMHSTCDCQAVSRPHLMTFVLPCNVSETDCVVTSSPVLSKLKSRLRCLSRFSTCQALLYGVMLVMSARSWPKNKHLATCDVWLLDLVWSNGSGLSSVTSCTARVCTELPCSIPRSFTSTSICLDRAGAPLLFPCQCTLLFCCFVTFHWPMADDFCVCWELLRCCAWDRWAGPVTTKSSPCVIPGTQCPPCRNKLLKRSPNCCSIPFWDALADRASCGLLRHVWHTCVSSTIQFWWLNYTISLLHDLSSPHWFRNSLISLFSPISNVDTVHHDAHRIFNLSHFSKIFHSNTIHQFLEFSLLPTFSKFFNFDTTRRDVLGAFNFSNFSDTSNSRTIHHSVLNSVPLHFFCYASVVCDDSQFSNVDVSPTANVVTTLLYGGFSFLRCKIVTRWHQVWRVDFVHAGWRSQLVVLWVGTNLGKHFMRRVNQNILFSTINNFGEKWPRRHRRALSTMGFSRDKLANPDCKSHANPWQRGVFLFFETPNVLVQQKKTKHKNSSRLPL